MTQHSQPKFITIGALVLIGSRQAMAQDPPVLSPANDLALGKDASLSDNGWGGGTSKADLTSGFRMYGSYPNNLDWARGLALPWDGQEHQITIDFGAPTTIGSIIQWHHGAGPGGMGAETPASYDIQYWNGSLSGWSTVLSTNDPSQFLKYPNADPDLDWFGYWSTPYENSFSPVTTDKIRIKMTAVPGRYNWLYQVEAYAPVPEPASLSALGVGAVALLRRLRK